MTDEIVNHFLSYDLKQDSKTFKNDEEEYAVMLFLAEVIYEHLVYDLVLDLMVIN